MNGAKRNGRKQHCRRITEMAESKFRRGSEIGGESGDMCRILNVVDLKAFSYILTSKYQGRAKSRKYNDMPSINSSSNHLKSDIISVKAINDNAFLRGKMRWHMVAVRRGGGGGAGNK
jgi:hypothetical protein